MSQFQLSPEQLNQLLGMASKKMGTDPDALKQQMETGKPEDFIKGLPKDKQAQISALMNNPKAIEQLMQNPQVQTLMQRLMGK